MGVSGSGKTTIGVALAQRLGCPYIEGDDLHPPSNVAKMREGTPLTDQDRAPWLAALAAKMKETKDSGQSCVVACSALKSAYRKTLTIDNDVRFVMLEISYETALERLNNRKGHFMPASLLKSQFQTLQEPHDAIAVNAEQQIEHIVDDIFKKLPTTNAQ
ncbi:MAG: gluconokinase [Leptolyngbya sp.]|nr:gluconokinase [Candidatus Melainabacteria bacterium]